MGADLYIPSLFNPTQKKYKSKFKTAVEVKGRQSVHHAGVQPHDVGENPQNAEALFQGDVLVFQGDG